MSLTSLPKTDPTAILRYRDGLYAVDLLTAAVVEFDFFTRLAESPGSFEELCEQFGWAPRPADVLVSLSKANGLLAEAPEGTIQVTRLAAEHLVTGSSWSLIPYYETLRDRPVAKDFAKVLKTGRPAHWSGNEAADSDWHDAMRDDEFAKSFTAAMDCRGMYLGKRLADAVGAELVECRKVLDIGGGSGVYASALVANHENLSGVVLEQSPVDDLAREKVEARKLADRVEIVSGDMFEGDWPDGADVHLFSNVMHDWDVPEIERLVEKSFAALPEGGRILIHEAFLNAEKNGPLPVVEYSCILMHSTQGRCYGTAEMQGLLEKAGFVDSSYRETACDRGVIIARKPESGD